MQLETLSLEQLRNQLRKLDAHELTQSYPGSFLLPMGFLSVEEIRAVKDLNSTAGVRFRNPLRHDLKQDHPLAGIVFFLPASSADQSHSIGRSEECGIVVPDDSVSYRHCQLQLGQAGELLATDLGSTNGTKVNLDSVDVGVRTALGAEDILTLGRYSFQVHTADSLFEALALIMKMDSSTE